MIRFLMVMISVFLFTVSAMAQDDSLDSTPATSPITTHWTTLGGMQYLQNDKVLNGSELKTVIESLNDPQANSFLSKSESDETVGFIGLGGSVGLSLLSLLFPNTHIYVIGLDISTPYLPIAAPGAVLGLAGGLLVLESSTAKYAAVQRYDRVTKQSDSITWNLSPRNDGLVLEAGYSF
jgi:hypothetical protein